MIREQGEEVKALRTALAIACECLNRITEPEMIATMTKALREDHERLTRIATSALRLFDDMMVATNNPLSEEYDHGNEDKKEAPEEAHHEEAGGQEERQAPQHHPQREGSGDQREGASDRQ